MTPAPVRARTNSEWLRELRATDDEQAAALGELRAYLVRAARYALYRSRGGPASSSASAVDQLAEDCAQEALMAILQHLEEFRGDSRFTTWAYKFAINVALAAGRRETWKHVSLDALLDEAARPTWLTEPESPMGNPEQAARRAEAWAVVRQVTDEELTERQRQALKALVFDEVPLDELVRHWGSTRNAVYKLLHDARRRLKTRLEARGFAPRDILELFSGPR
jgi:RNA polymerase sigma-70 factor (ECF subfamily)